MTPTRQLLTTTHLITRIKDVASAPGFPAGPALAADLIDLVRRLPLDLPPMADREVTPAQDDPSVVYVAVERTNRPGEGRGTVAAGPSGQASPADADIPTITLQFSRRIVGRYVQPFVTFTALGTGRFAVLLLMGGRTYPPPVIAWQVPGAAGGTGVYVTGRLDLQADGADAAIVSVFAALLAD